MKFFAESELPSIILRLESKLKKYALAAVSPTPTIRATIKIYYQNLGQLGKIGF